MVASPKVATYDLKPEMSAGGIASLVTGAIEKRDFDVIVMNFANADMVGHSGKMEPTVKAVEVVDGMIGRIASATLERKGALAITADHGNAELKVDLESGKPLTAHTTSAVPFVLANQILGGQGVVIDDSQPYPVFGFIEARLHKVEIVHGSDPAGHTHPEGTQP